jgi:predicted nucleic acid-binding protein
VLNEFASVASRKFKMSWVEIQDVLAQVRVACSVEPVTMATHDRALALVKRHQLSWYDALIVASALIAECDTLYSEDIQDGKVIERRLTIRNPFSAI